LTVGEPADQGTAATPPRRAVDRERGGRKSGFGFTLVFIN